MIRGKKKKKKKKRNNYYKKLFYKVGECLRIEPNFKCEFGKNISIGDVIYINFGCIILDCVNITIGCHISNEPNFALYAAKYSIYPEERIVGGYYGKLITIEDNVWIGDDVNNITRCNY